MERECKFCHQDTGHCGHEFCPKCWAMLAPKRQADAILMAAGISKAKIVSQSVGPEPLKRVPHKLIHNLSRKERLEQKLAKRKAKLLRAIERRKARMGQYNPPAPVTAPSSEQQREAVAV